ncbi:MAG: hypothetical protein GY940_38415 [bacterium]|nr:hypothetical protein [bacterium]
MTKKVIMLIAAVLMVVGPSLMAEPQGRRDRMKHSRFGTRLAEKNLFPGKMILRFKDELGLTADQAGKIERMGELVKEASIRGKADVKVQEMKLQSYLKKDQVSRKKLESMIRDIAKMKTDMHIDHMNYLLDVKGVLTAEQIGKVEDFKKNMRKRMRKRGMRGKRGQRGKRGNYERGKRSGGPGTGTGAGDVSQDGSDGENQIG